MNSNLLGQDFFRQHQTKNGLEISLSSDKRRLEVLAFIIDLYSRQVVGCSMSTRMTTTLVCDVLSMALLRSGISEEVIIYSDRGNQYRSKDYRDLIAAHNLKQSMSRKGDCWKRLC